MTSATGQRPLLEVRGLSKSLGGRTVVEGVSFSLVAGEVVALVGPNGAGKSTILRLIMGEIAGDEGRVLLEGEEVTGEPVHRRARRGMGYLPQGPSVFAGLSVARNLEAVLELRRRPLQEASSWLETFGLSSRRDQRASDLSGGERRRLELARLLIGEPRLLLLDEPFKGLDGDATAALGAAIQEILRRGGGVLVAEPRLEQFQAIGGRILHLTAGRLIGSGEGTPLGDAAGADTPRSGGEAGCGAGPLPRSEPPRPGGLGAAVI